MSEQWTMDKEVVGYPVYIYSGDPPEENRIIGKIYLGKDAAFIVKAVNNHEALVKALEALANAKAIAGVRGIVAGWNGEGRAEPYNERHPPKLGATLPKTNCGAVYALDEALQEARRLLAVVGGPNNAS